MAVVRNEIHEGRGRAKGTTPVQRGRWLLLALVALLAIGGWPGGMPEASGAVRQSTTCGVPLAVAARTSASAATPAVSAPVRRGVATPAAAVEVAASPDPAAALEREVTAVAYALAACLSSGRGQLVVTLATERYLGQLYGGGVPLAREDYLALASELDPVATEIRSVRDVERVADNEATAEVVSVVGRQLLRSRWTFVQAAAAEQDPGRTPWRVDQETAVPFDPPSSANRLEVAMEEYAYGLVETEVAGPTVVLAGRNGGAEDHEMLVLQFSDGMTTTGFLREAGPALPEGVSYVGQATVPAGGRAELVLVDLEPGVYTIVCLFPTDRGTPHLALGMEAEFTVTS